MLWSVTPDLYCFCYSWRASLFKETGARLGDRRIRMLPRSTSDRMDREAARCGRTLEIQRLIGRALRAAVDEKLGENTIHIDCDVIQADETRTAAIGACVALVDALRYMKKNMVKEDPLVSLIAAISVGIYRVNRCFI